MKDQKVSEDFFIISCEEDYKICLPLVKKGSVHMSFNYCSFEWKFLSQKYRANVSWISQAWKHLARNFYWMVLLFRSWSLRGRWTSSIWNNYFFSTSSRLIENGDLIICTHIPPHRLVDFSQAQCTDFWNKWEENSGSATMWNNLQTAVFIHLCWCFADWFPL